MSAQQLLPIHYDTLYKEDSYKHELIFSGLADYASTSLNNELSRKILFGGYINEGIKHNNLDNHGLINRFGLDVSGEFEYRNYSVNFKNRKQIGLIVKVGSFNYGSLVYGKEAFGLAFFGNDYYAGQKADFSGTRFLGMSVQKIGAGLFNKQSKNALTLNLYSISNYVDGQIYSGQLAQSSLLDSISLVLDGKVDYSTSGALIKGWGAGFDLDFKFPVQLNEKKKAVIRFEAKNLGIYSFGESLTRYKADTVIHFNGYTFDQFISSTANSTFTFNVADTLGIDSLGVRKWRFLPAFLQIGKIVSENDPSRIQTFFGIRMYGLAAYVPMLYAGLDYKLARFVNLGMNASLGGFGNFRFGIYTNWKVGKFTCGLGSENLMGFFLNNAKGESLSIRLRSVF